jgi:tetratricopeptide (TPR) repeat protein
MKKYIAVAVIIVVAALLIVPLTRNILREQINISPAPVVSNDYLVQIAQAEEVKPGDIVDSRKNQYSQIDRLRSLIAAYPTRPDAYGALLVNENRFGIVSADRKDLNSEEKTESIIAAKQLLADSEASIKVDPKNGFPLSQKASALLVLNRNSEAIAAIDKASQCPKWDDYISSLAQGDISYTEAGWPNTLDDFQTMEGIMFPHYGRYRGIARAMARLALNYEKTGDIEKGYKIRKTAFEYGKTMVKHSKFIICGFVGAAFENIAFASLPEGNMSPNTPNRTSRTKNQEIYISFLKNHGEAFKAREVRALVAQAQFHNDELLRLSKLRSYDGFFWPPAFRSEITEYLIEKQLLLAGILAAILLTVFALFKAVSERLPDKFSPLRIIMGLITAICIGWIAFTIPTINHIYNHDYDCSQFFMKPGQMGLPDWNPDDKPNQDFIISQYPVLLLSIMLGVMLITAIASMIIARKRGASGFTAFAGSFANSSFAALALVAIVYVAILPSFLSNNKQTNWHITHNMLNETQYAAKLTHTTWPPKL